VTTIRTVAVAALAAGGSLATLTSCTQQAAMSPSGGTAASATGGARRDLPREKITVAANEQIPNLPGKRLVSHVVEFPPGGGSVPHRHAKSAFVYAYVVAGAVRSQVNGQPARVYRAGEVWFESPGSHHRVSENASDTEPAKLLAVVIVDAADQQVTIPDAR